MKTARILSLTSLILVSQAPAMAQEVKVGGLLQVWYTQMTNDNLRVNGAAPGGYYNLRSEFKENTFTIRRAEIKVSGKVTEDIDFEVMADPSINTSATNPTILQDAFLTWKPGAGFSLRAGQMKIQQTYEGTHSSSEILFAERSQLGRVFGDKRDRGLVASQEFGDPKGFAGKFSLGAFNGMSDAISGKGTDTNAQKDFVARLELSLDKVQKFGVYTLQGSTDVTDKASAAIAPATPPAGWPNQAAIYDNKDKTTNLGAFYAYQDDTWTFTGEYITGLLGRRFPTLAASSPAVKREHLDQKYAGFYVTGGYTFGNHTLLARYDVLNYNSGNQWYTATNPYTTNTATGAPLGADYSPKYTELTLGYTYAWKPEKVKAANLKLNYIARSKNFLKPAPGQSGEQGGDSLVAALQIAF